MTEQHPDLDALADLLAGEGTADDVEHVAHCADCSATLADLDDALDAVDPALAALLAAPLPPLPDDFDARLTAGLAQATVDPAPERPVAAPVALPDAWSEDDEQRPAAPVVPLAPRRRARGAGLLGVAAGGAGLLLAGVLGLSLAGGSGGGDEAASQALPESAAGGAADSATSGEATSGPRVLASGTDYPSGGGEVAALLPALVGSEQSAAEGGRTAAQAPVPASEALRATEDAQAGLEADDPLARLREPAALQACLEAVAATAAGSTPQVTPVALDYASTDGRPALVVVQPAGPGLVEVTAVGPACGQGGPDRLWSHRLPG